MHDLRVKGLKKIKGFYSIYAATIVIQNNVPGFKMSESTIRNYLKKGKLGGLTYNDVRIMKHRNRNHEKKTTPHNVPSKIGHHILEGDAMASKVGDNTAISSFLDRRTAFQWLVKISRETQQCFHGYLKKVIDSIHPINTITFGNGSEMSNVGKLGKIVFHIAETTYENQ